MRLPKELFAKIETDERGVDDPWISASATIESAVGDDSGEQNIGVYKLVEVRRVERRLHVLKTSRG